MGDGRKESGGLNLTGWAAMLTAIATVLTAIGFPEFFPSVVERILSKSSLESQNIEGVKFDCQSTGSSLSTVVLRPDGSGADPIIKWD